MADNVFLGGTVRIAADFQTFSNSATPAPINPVSVTVAISNTADPTNTPVFSDTWPVGSGRVFNTGPGVFYIDWTTTAIGQYVVAFTGTFADGYVGVITTEMDVISIYTLPTVSSTLEEDQYIDFILNVSPLYVDPEEIMPLFPSAAETEIIDLIFQYSMEANEVTGITDLASADMPPFAVSWMIQQPVPSVTPFIREFVKASVCCALTRIYDPGQGADELSMVLADLQVTRRNAIKATVTRATATTWCELAMIIRDELYRTSRGGGMRSIIKGAKIEVNPIPERILKHQEWRGWQGRNPRRGNNFDSPAGGGNYYQDF